ncbi:hypothetical protein GJAV_G00171360 [Gymnothorax javanicus]|nr:hypothetical protein GJAV_G00171360 [Gymnothorax javanicus]
MNATAPSVQGESAIHYMLLPVFFMAVIGFCAAGVMYISKRRRLDRLRQLLVPVYTYDPSEEGEEVEQEILLRSPHSEAVLGWTGCYQYRHTLLVKNGSI